MSRRPGLFGSLGTYDTKLNSSDEVMYDTWRRKLPEGQQSAQDYDLRGAWQAGLGRAGNGHFPDTYKKPNHPTFNNESVYSTPEHQGGQWAGTDGGPWTFWASPENVRNMPVLQLQDYFRRVEPDSNVVFPFDYRMPGGDISR